jgi:nicotinamidase-related amidase
MNKIFIFLFLHIKVAESGIKVYKGTNPDVDSYSVFWDNKKLTDTTLQSQLRMKNCTDIYICGLAYDVCVGEFKRFIFSSLDFA